MKANNSIVKAEERKPRFSEAIMGNALQNVIAKSMPSKEEASRLTGALIQIVGSSKQLQECIPATIVSSALRGEGMGLVLGQGYHVIPFKNHKEGTSSASFLLSYKGYIQLALATGRYADIDCLEVREGELKGRNPRTGKPVVDFSVYATDEERLQHKVIGYYAYFELKDGMFKSEYWSMEKLLKHADRYSVAFNIEDYKKLITGKYPEKDKWKLSSPWYDVDGKQEIMCKKTVLRSLLNSGYAPITNAVRTLINQELTEERSGERVVTPEMMKVEKEINGEPISENEAVTVDGEIIDIPEEEIISTGDSESGKSNAEDDFFN